jgi:hypothetical protein
MRAHAIRTGLDDKGVVIVDAVERAERSSGRRQRDLAYSFRRLTHPLSPPSIQ